MAGRLATLDRCAKHRGACGSGVGGMQCSHVRITSVAL